MLANNLRYKLAEVKAAWRKDTQQCHLSLPQDLRQIEATPKTHIVGQWNGEQEPGPCAIPTFAVGMSE